MNFKRWLALARRKKVWGKREEEREKTMIGGPVVDI
jgi:hypothetical protein